MSEKEKTHEEKTDDAFCEALKALSDAKANDGHFIVLTAYESDNGIKGFGTATGHPKMLAIMIHKLITKADSKEILDALEEVAEEKMKNHPLVGLSELLKDFLQPQKKGE